MLTSNPASIIGKGFTVMVTLSEDEHPFPSVPINVYVVVVVAEETGFEIVELLKDPAGDQTYPVAPVPLSVVVFPIHIAVAAPASTVGKGFTVIVTEEVDVQTP